jgi:hypothetical protein
MKAKRGYMCATDYAYDLEGDYFGTKIYPSLKALIDNRQCTKQCGIVRVKIERDKRLTKGTL